MNVETKLMPKNNANTSCNKLVLIFVLKNNLEISIFLLKIKFTANP